MKASKLHRGYSAFGLPFTRTLNRGRGMFFHSLIHIYIYMHIYMRMCHMCHHPRTYPLILVGVAQQRAHVPMCHHDFFRLLGPSPLSDLGTHNCTISGRAIVGLDPNLWSLWRRFTYFMNNPNCTPKYHPGSSSLEITSNQELQRRRSCGSSSWCFWDFDRSMGNFPAMFDDTYPTHPYTKKWHRRA